MCHYILNIQIFLTNIRNGGIRMQRFFLGSALRNTYCEYMFVKMNMKKESHKSISCRVYFFILIFIHGAIKIYVEALFGFFYSLYCAKFITIFLIHL
jgi:hypothetical protein